MAVTQEQIDKGRKIDSALDSGATSEAEAKKATRMMLGLGSDKSNSINTTDNSINNADGTAGALTNLRNNIAPEGTDPVTTPATPANNGSNTELNKNIDIVPEGQENMDYNDTKNEDFLFNTMAQGGVVAGGGMATDRARKRWEGYNKLSAIPYNTIGDSLINGSMKMYDRSMTDLKNMNPELFAQIQEYVTKKNNIDDINSVGTAIYEGMGGNMEEGDTYSKYKIESEKKETPSIFEDYNNKLAEKIKAQFGDRSSEMFTLTQQIMQNPELQLQKTKISKLEGEQAKLQEDLYNVGDDVRSKLGSEALDSFTSAYISNQSKSIQKLLRTKGNELMVEESILAGYMDEVEQTLDALYKGMEWDAEIAKEQAKASASSGGSGGGGGTGTSGNTGYDNLYKDMVSGNFSGSFTATNMKAYGLGPTTKAGMVSWIGNNVSIEEIASIKNNAFFSEKEVEEMKKIWGTKEAMKIKKILDSGLSEEEQDAQIKELIMQLPESVRKDILKSAGVKGGRFFGVGGRRGDILDD